MRRDKRADSEDEHQQEPGENARQAQRKCNPPIPHEWIGAQYPCRQLKLSAYTTETGDHAKKRIRHEYFDKGYDCTDKVVRQLKRSIDQPNRQQSGVDCSFIAEQCNPRSEERRVGKESRSRTTMAHY